MARISSASLVSTLLFLTGTLGLVDGSSEEETREGGASTPTGGSSSVVTAFVGTTASLTCSLPIDSESVVGWMRKKDMVILAIGHILIAVDRRFHVGNEFPSDSWLLQIDSVKMEDSGAYECFDSSKPTNRHVVHLSVVAQSEVGTDAAEPSTVNVAVSGLESGSTLEVTTAGTGGSEENRKLDEYETGETRGLTLAEVQRLAMLKQLRVLAAQEGAIKLQMEVLRLQKENLMCVKEQSLRQAENGHVHKLV